MRWSAALVGLASFAAVACASTAVGTAGGGASPAPTGPAAAAISFSGEGSLGRPLVASEVDCNEPELAGQSIVVSGRPQGEPSDGLFVLMTIRASYVSVSVRTGQAATYRERDFSGSGVTAFDAARGVKISGPVTDSTDAGTNKGTIGNLTAVSGTVSCGGQRAGSSAVRITGMSAEGPVDTTLTPVRVACTNGNNGIFVSITGLGKVGDTKVFSIVTLGQSSIGLLFGAHFYSKYSAVKTSVNLHGGSVDDDVSEAGGTHTLHLSGSSVCG